MLAALVLGQWVWLVAILGLALLITVHEFGHFIAAKSFGMRVEKFYVGFPPAALRRTWGETEYGIGIIPLGGFCKISGMTPEEEVPEDTGDRVYYKKAVWKRNITIAAGPFMNFLAAAVILVLFVGIQGVPKADAHAGRGRQGRRRRPRPASSPATRSSARTARRGPTWDQASAYFRAHPDKTIELTYQPKAGGPERPSRSRWCENPQAPGSGYLGVRAGVARERPGPVEAVTLGVSGFKDVVVGTFTGFWWLFSGKISATGPDGAVGPVGIINVSHQAVQQSWYPDPARVPQLQPRPHQPAADPAVRRRAHRHERRGADPRPAPRLAGVRAHGRVRHRAAGDAVHLPDVQRREAAVRRVASGAARRRPVP